MSQEEIIPHDNTFAPEIIGYVKSNEALADPATRRDYFERLSEDDFLAVTQRIASMVRTGDSNQLQHFDGAKMTLRTMEVPDQREKEQLLRETWRTAQVLLSDRKLSDEDALEYAGLTVAGGLLYSHLFDDANGRTSRMLSYIIEKGAESVDDIEAMTTASGGGGAWDVYPNSQLALPSTRQFQGDQPDRIVFATEASGGISGEQDDGFGGDFVNSDYNASILRVFIERADDPETRAIIEACSSADRDGYTILDGDKLLKELAISNGAVEYAQILSGASRELRADFVHRYLLGMVSEVAIEQRIEQYPGMTRKSRQVNEHMAGEIVKRTANGLLLPREQAAIRHRALSSIHRR